MNDNYYFQPITDEYFLSHAIGNVRFGMTNDYMFRVIFQENKFALKGLLESVLHLEEDTITDLEIKNTILRQVPDAKCQG